MFFFSSVFYFFFIRFYFFFWLFLFRICYRFRPTSVIKVSKSWSEIGLKLWQQIVKQQFISVIRIQRRIEWEIEWANERAPTELGWVHHSDSSDDNVCASFWQCAVLRKNWVASRQSQAALIINCHISRQRDSKILPSPCDNTKQHNIAQHTIWKWMRLITRYNTSIYILIH